MKIKFILITISFTFLSSCQKTETYNPDYFAFGTAYGECQGNCARFFLIRDNNLYPDDMDYYSAALKFKNEPLSTDKYIIARQLLENFPEYLQENPNRTFGCPDCADQGGIHIEIRENGDVKFWHIDTVVSAQPVEIQPYIQNVLDVLGQLL